MTWQPKIVNYERVRVPQFLHEWRPHKAPKVDEILNFTNSDTIAPRVPRVDTPIPSKRTQYAANKDSLLKASVIFVDPLSEERRYLQESKVEETIKSVAKINSQNHVSNFVDVPRIARYPNYDAYVSAIEVYEHNQMCILERIEMQQVTDDLIRYINELESWFIQIVEPLPLDPINHQKWYEREKYKIEHHTTFHCDDTIRAYVTLPESITASVKSNFDRLRIPGHVI